MKTRRRRAAVKSAKDAQPNADSEPVSVKAADPASAMATKTVKRKREANPAANAPSACAIAPLRPTIVLASNCNVRDASELQQSLCRHLDEAATVTLDIRKLERVDTSTLQLLCAFVRDRAARERKVEWLGDSPILREAAQLLGVAELLALPGAAT
jgi:ABC-type transporter Mla MlaB component